MNKILKIICIGLIVAGAVVAVISDVPIVDYSAIIVAFAGAALTCITTYKKSEKKDWKVITSIIMLAVGAFALAFAGVSADTMTTILSAVAGIALLLISLFVSSIKN